MKFNKILLCGAMLLASAGIFSANAQIALPTSHDYPTYAAAASQFEGTYFGQAFNANMNGKVIQKPYDANYMLHDNGDGTYNLTGNNTFGKPNLDLNAVVTITNGQIAFKSGSGSVIIGPITKNFEIKTLTGSVKTVNGKMQLEFHCVAYISLINFTATFDYKGTK
ncbi:hypothetical protein [Porphyromonas pogonae]|uniref:hypothetical protein n=1 Tax=Porphyromonas pogonae TaxID=867595 RepID=UPI002E77062A|nr:hypothetical protein [Porphyromonas pogonae]